MTAGPLTAQGVADHLASLGRQLDDLVKQIGDAERAAVNGREDYTMAYAQQFLKAQGAMDARKQIAIEHTHDTRLAAELAEAEVRGLRRQIESVRVRIDVGRSVGAAMRAEASLASSAGTP
jgi:hypothetical protein